MAKVKFLDRKIWQRVLGIPATQKPQDPGCWSVSGKTVTVNLEKASELGKPGGALRMEGNGLPLRLLVIKDDQGEFRAYENRCTHLGHRRLDPVPGGGSVQCCSVNKSTFDYTGQNLHGPGKKPIRSFPVQAADGKLTIEL